ncbi:MAG: hypothetical protein J6A91_05690 [Bacteroidales bacterium]|nr:hypothetical protein [Bacteroidales bacterium]
MKLNIYALAVAVLMPAGYGTASAQQQEKQPDVYEQAEQEADRLQGLLDLEDWQVFYVDSTLKHDFPAMMADYEELRKAKVANQSMYQDVHDKWMDQIDKTYMRIFTDEQWAKYLKNGAARAQKARAKRKEKK